MRVTRLVLGVLLWILVLGLTAIPPSIGSVRRLVTGLGWLSWGTTTQVTMLAGSVLIMLALGRGKLSRYGFRTASLSQIKDALVFGSIVAVVVHVGLAILWRLLPPSGAHPALGGASFVRIVLTVWILASICEEVLHRGLIQSFLEPLRGYGVTVFGIRLSLPVITAAILFGLMHIMLLVMGADGFLVGGIVGSGIVLGLVAGYYREKTGSLIPAMLVHMLFNVCAAASAYIQNIVTG